MANPIRRNIIRMLSAIPFLGTVLASFAHAKTQLESSMNPHSKMFEEYLKKLRANFPFEIISVAGKNALEEWERLRAIGTAWPVIVGDNENLNRILDQFTPETFSNGVFIAFDKSTKTISQIVAEAHKLRFPNDLKDWEGAYLPEDLTAPKGIWPSEIIGFAQGPTVNIEILSGKYFDEVHIILIPTKNGWEVPAFLNWGNWNACPPAKFHVAALKMWHDLYGAELVSLSGDMLEVRVTRKPKTRTEALKLADELYYYCADLIDQGFETKSNLAAALMSSHWWSFWWD